MEGDAERQPPSTPSVSGTVGKERHDIRHDGVHMLLLRVHKVRARRMSCSLVTDQGLQAVAELKALTHLYLTDCSLVTDQGLQAVAGLTSLTKLSLNNIPVTDAGIQYLSSLKKLTFIDLDGCRTSDAAEEELCRQIPGLHIIHNHRPPH